ncbi:MAG: 2-succinyl-5-enolpyruvyl-6-hydroxy-3-cyclohexene-1-carboxylic-acid synthase [Cyanothece sp. SIO1E1]|nr:2-succinyl-5-enolpyruvyl-6-hydroxy-3-cyclohexene-1-carboxylic-acid synthase [Cyanothece sp. SIO1E1]
MPINFSNLNSIWTSILVETLKRLGLTHAVICPGSRSTPLAVAFAEHHQIAATPVLDERSAAFFALGIARKTKHPTALVCTSGTAGANFYPAVIEARESRVSLLILTADRPPELRDCNAGQTIDQQKLFGSFVNWYAELAIPTLEVDMLAYLRQTAIHAWERSHAPIPGPVHLNLPFRDPLAPTPQSAAQTLKSSFNIEDFFADVDVQLAAPLLPCFPAPLPSSLLSTWQTCSRGVIIAGLAQPQDPQQYCEAIAHLSKVLGWPVLAEGLSPVRNYAHLNPHLVSTYDVLLRNQRLAEKLTPEQVIHIGPMPTSKTLRQWLASTRPRQWIVDEGDRNLDPLHGLGLVVRKNQKAVVPQGVNFTDAPIFIVLMFPGNVSGKCPGQVRYGDGWFVLLIQLFPELGQGG